LEVQMRDPQNDNWNERIERALALLASRLDEPASLDELAAAAGISPFHFHRAWRAMTGEPVGKTVRRLRIAASQQRLRAGASTVTEVAMDGGFGTSQSFARAFRQVAGLSPSDFLASGLAQKGVEPDPAADIRIELRPECRLLALRREGGAYRELNALFHRIWYWADEQGKLANLEGVYGIPLDDPESVPEDQLRYDACLAVGDPGTPPPPFHIVTLPAGDYACLPYQGSYDAFEASDQAIIRWAIASGRMPADLPLIHHSFDDPDNTPPEDCRAEVLLLLQPEETKR
jgi:AraC family transcriptional regulator